MIKSLLNIQATVNKIQKDAANPFFKSRYVTLEAILTELLPALAKEGIFISQPVDLYQDHWYVETILHDAEGTMNMGKVPIVNPKGDPQSMGAAISYARRYALQNAFCLWASDDDAELAMPRPTQEPPKPASPTKAVKEPKPAPVASVRNEVEKPAETLTTEAKPASEPAQKNASAAPAAQEPIPLGAVRFDYNSNDHKKMIVTAIRQASIPAAHVSTIRKSMEAGYWKDNVVLADVENLLFHFRKICMKQQESSCQKMIEETL